MLTDSGDRQDQKEYRSKNIFDLVDQAVNDDIYSPKSELDGVPVHRNFSCFLDQDRPLVFVAIDDFGAAIKFSPANHDNNVLGAPCTAILGDPKTGLQRDTFGWAYATSYLKDWYVELPTNPTRQEVCDYINDKLKGYFDSQFETLAQAIKDRYPQYHAL